MKTTILIFIISCFILKSWNNKKSKENKSKAEQQSNDNRWEQDYRWKQDLGSKNTEDSYIIKGNDTINKIDQNGMLQGEWERLHPDGSFKCRGIYRDGYKMGLWER